MSAQPLGNPLDRSVELPDVLFSLRQGTLKRLDLAVLLPVPVAVPADLVCVHVDAAVIAHLGVHLGFLPPMAVASSDGLTSDRTTDRRRLQENL